MTEASQTFCETLSVLECNVDPDWFGSVPLPPHYLIKIPLLLCLSAKTYCTLAQLSFLSQQFVKFVLVRKVKIDTCNFKVFVCGIM